MCAALFVLLRHPACRWVVLDVLGPANKFGVNRMANRPHGRSCDCLESREILISTLNSCGCFIKISCACRESLHKAPVLSVSE